MKTPDEILNSLPDFSGTCRYNPYSLGLHLTDGVKWLAEAAQCYWLLDVVASTQLVRKVRAEELHVHKLKVDLKKQKAVFWVEDGNGNKVYTQRIGYTDFPLPEITLWQIGGVIMLPSEY